MKNSLRGTETRARPSFCLFLMSTVFWPFSTMMCKSAVLIAKLTPLWEGSKPSLLVDIKVYMSRMINDWLTLSPWVKNDYHHQRRNLPHPPSPPSSPAQKIPSAFQNLNVWTSAILPFNLTINLSWKAQTGLPKNRPIARELIDQIIAMQWNKILTFSRLR